MWTNYSIDENLICKMDTHRKWNSVHTGTKKKKKNELRTQKNGQKMFLQLSTTNCLAALPNSNTTHYILYNIETESEPFLVFCFFFFVHLKSFNLMQENKWEKQNIRLRSAVIRMKCD